MKAFSRAHLKELDALVRMALSRARRAEGAGSGNSFVYQPGGPVAHDNVYTTWPTLMPAVNAVAGVRTVLIDPTFAGVSGPTVPAGAWNLNNVFLYGQIPMSGFLPQLTFEDGATVVGTTGLYIENLDVISASTTPVFTYAGGIGAFFTIINASLLGSSTAPIIKAAADSGAITLIMLSSSSLGDAAFSALESDNAGAGNVIVGVLEGATANPLATSGTGAILFDVADSGSVIAPQLAGGVVTFLSDASRVTYTPAVLANWSGTAPSSVTNALDRIAAKVGPIP